MWKCSASSRHKPNQKTELFYEDVYVRLELYCSGLAVLSKNEQNFHLHHAVFDNNLPVLRRVASREQLGVFHASLNEIDAMGNTALMLAVRLRRLDAVLILCDLFADPKHRPLPHFQNAIDLAVKAQSKPILKILLAACQKNKQHYLDENRERLFSLLEQLPDFKLDMKFSCGSAVIPFLKKFTPSDTYKLFKRGSSVRLDMTLTGFRRMRCIRGDCSVIFKGRGTDNEGELVMVDHQNKSSLSILSDVVTPRVDEEMERLSKSVKFEKDYKAEKLQLEVAHDWKGEPIREKVDGYSATKHLAKCSYRVFTHKKFSINSDEMLLGKTSFSEYFDWSISSD